MTHEDLVIVGRFTHAQEAHMAKAFLEDNGIDGLVVQDFTFLDYVRLRVRREDAEEAILLIGSSAQALVDGAFAAVERLAIFPYSGRDNAQGCWRAGVLTC